VRERSLSRMLPVYLQFRLRPHKSRFFSQISEASSLMLVVNPPALWNPKIPQAARAALAVLGEPTATQSTLPPAAAAPRPAQSEVCGAEHGRHQWFGQRPPGQGPLGAGGAAGATVPGATALLGQSVIGGIASRACSARHLL
jgi:hypothetical protein